MAATETDPSAIRIRNDIRCGDLGRIIELHGTMYATEPGFGLGFEAFVARTIAEYVLDNGMKGRIWLAEHGEDLAGCTAVAERPGNSGQLRWVLVDRRFRGIGLGRRLVRCAIDYCLDRGFGCLRLETTDGLEASRELYRQLGFRTVSAEPAQLWSGPRQLITMEKSLDPAGAGT